MAFTKRPLVDDVTFLFPEQTMEALRADIGTPTPESIGTAVDAYFADNPLTATALEWGTDPKPKTIFENGLT